MRLVTQHVIPGENGKIFGTNASCDRHMDKIKKTISKIDGVIDVVLKKEAFPKEFVVLTNKLVKVMTIKNAVNKVGLHAIPKSAFPIFLQ